MKFHLIKPKHAMLYLSSVECGVGRIARIKNSQVFHISNLAFLSQVTILITNRKSWYVGFRLQQKSITLNDLERKFTALSSVMRIMTKRLRLEMRWFSVFTIKYHYTSAIRICASGFVISPRPQLALPYLRVTLSLVIYPATFVFVSSRL